MRTKFLLSVLVIFMSLSCSKTTQGNCPNCKTESFKKYACSKGAQIDEYEFQGSTAYVFEPGNCGADMTAEVTDENCKTLGQLGGFIGNTKINGEDFSKAKFKKTIWKN